MMMAQRVLVIIRLQPDFDWGSIFVFMCPCRSMVMLFFVSVVASSAWHIPVRNLLFSSVAFAGWLFHYTTYHCQFVVFVLPQKSAALHYYKTLPQSTSITIRIFTNIFFFRTSVCCFFSFFFVSLYLYHCKRVSLRTTNMLAIVFR